MKNITLIYPPCVYPHIENIVYSHCIGIRSISAFLKKESSCNVTFIDALMQGFSNIKPYANGYIVGLKVEEIIRRIPSDSDIIGLSTPFSILAPVAHNIVTQARQRFPNKMIVMGGVYPSTQPALALTSEADYIVVGEGEKAFRDLCNGKDPKKIKGVYSKNDIHNTFFPKSEQVEDLDMLPYPDYNIPNIDEYFKLSPRMTVGRTASLATSRGCPFSCEFCSVHPVYGKQFRARSPQAVLKEIEYLVNNHNINMIEFEDDNLTLQKDRCIGIFEGIIRLNEKNANLRWRTPNGVRIDTLDEDVISIMARSNCANITLALEHGDQEILKIMNKALKLEKVEEVVRLAVKYKIPKITFFLIAGYPGETLERFERAVIFLKKLRAIGGNMELIANNTQVYPGTPLLLRGKKEGWISDPHFDNFLIRKDLTSSRHFVTITTKDFNVSEVNRRRKILESIFEQPVP